MSFYLVSPVEGETDYDESDDALLPVPELDVDALDAVRLRAICAEVDRRAVLNRRFSDHRPRRPTPIKNNLDIIAGVLAVTVETIEMLTRGFSGVLTASLAGYLFVVAYSGMRRRICRGRKHPARPGASADGESCAEQRRGTNKRGRLVASLARDSK